MSRRIAWCRIHESQEDRESTGVCDWADDRPCDLVPAFLVLDQIPEEWPDQKQFQMMLAQVESEQVEYAPGLWVWQMETEIRDVFLAVLELVYEEKEKR